MWTFILQATKLGEEVRTLNSLLNHSTEAANQVVKSLEAAQSFLPVKGDVNVGDVEQMSAILMSSWSPGGELDTNTGLEDKKTLSKLMMKLSSSLESLLVLRKGLADKSTLAEIQTLHQVSMMISQRQLEEPKFTISLSAADF
jgi:hypothetical protein